MAASLARAEAARPCSRRRYDSSLSKALLLEDAAERADTVEPDRLRPLMLPPDPPAARSATEPVRCATIGLLLAMSTGLVMEGPLWPLTPKTRASVGSEFLRGGWGMNLSAGGVSADEAGANEAEE